VGESLFDLGVQVCVWRRELDPSISAYLAALERTSRLQAMETLSAQGRPPLTGTRPPP